MCWGLAFGSRARHAGRGVSAGLCASNARKSFGLSGADQLGASFAPAALAQLSAPSFLGVGSEGCFAGSGMCWGLAFGSRARHAGRGGGAGLYAEWALEARAGELLFFAPFTQLAQSRHIRGAKRRYRVTTPRVGGSGGGLRRPGPRVRDWRGARKSSRGARKEPRSAKGASRDLQPFEWIARKASRCTRVNAAADTCGCGSLRLSPTHPGPRKASRTPAQRQ